MPRLYIVPRLYFISFAGVLGIVTIIAVLPVEESKGIAGLAAFGLSLLWLIMGGISVRHTQRRFAEQGKPVWPIGVAWGSCWLGTLVLGFVMIGLAGRTLRTRQKVSDGKRNIRNTRIKRQRFTPI